MANYHLSIKIFSRGGGASAVQKAAYRAGENLTCEYDGREHDYTRKGGVVHTEILLPNHAPSDYADRAVLWNAVEKSERYCTAQLAREVEVSLPVELTREQNIDLARKFAHEVFVIAGMCADVCVHDKGDGNPHAHIMLTMRPIEKDGTWGAKSTTVNGRKIPTVDWNDRDRAEDWRRAWATYQNTALRNNGHDAVVDHRSYERQGLDIIPTVHLGPAASQIERKGIRTERGDQNREIEFTNRQIRQLRARLNRLSDWITEEAANIAKPTLHDVLSGILSGEEGRSRYRQIADLKSAAHLLLFLQHNDITDMEGLERKVQSMRSRTQALLNDLKPVERRLAALKEHIRQGEYYREFRGIYKQYQQQKPKYQEAFRETHRREITLYEAAERYLKPVLNGHPLNLKKWREQFAAKTAEKDALYREYNKLKTEAKNVETIQRSVKEILHSNEPERTAQKSRGVAL